MGFHLPYGITQCYLPPDIGERTPPALQPRRPVVDLPTLEKWQAKLTWMAWLNTHEQSPISLT